MRIGVMPSPQNTTWPAMRRVALTADLLGCYSLWCSDHLYAPPPWPPGGTFDSLSVLAAWAELTSRTKIGGMVHPIAIRDPALLVKALTTVDHISGGRVCLGVGAGWYEDEHQAYGYPFGTPRDRVDRLAEGAALIRALLAGDAATGTRHYQHLATRNMPTPLGNIPILVGGQGSRTLAVVARYADMWNVYGTLDTVIERDARLRRHCERVGRDESAIERTYHVGPVVIRDSTADASSVARMLYQANGFRDQPMSTATAAALSFPPSAIGSVAEIEAALRPFVDLGFRHMYFDLLSPYDDETLDRLITELGPALDG